MTSGTSRYRQAWNAGNTGSALPGGLADVADADPLIDQAHDAGRANVPFDDWAAANVKTPSRRAPASPPRARRTSSPRSSSPGRKAPSRPRPTFPSPKKPLGGLGAGEGLAGVFMGCVAYALGISVVHYGVKGPLYWFKAKFLNEPVTKGSSSGTAKGTVTA